MSKKQLTELKTSAFERHLSIAKASLTVGKRWAANSAKGIFQSSEQKQKTSETFAKEQAQFLVEELGKLKGSVVKIGQMLALYGESILPKTVVEALHTLDAQTAPLSWQVIHRAIYDELGQKMHELHIDEMPIGTASLAQVHRATIIATGEQIVLKVQYPGVADAIDSDLSLFKQLLKLSNLVPQTKALDDWFLEIQSLLHGEVDYQKEAATTAWFYDTLKDDDRYIVPKIYPKFCTPRLLAMSFERGVPLTDPAIKALSPEQKNALGQAAIDIVIKEIFVWGQMQTDPNFGNYLVRLEQKPVLVLLDFGAVKAFDDKLTHIAQNLLKAGFWHDKDKMMTAMQGYDFFDTMSRQVKSDMAEVFLLATEPFANPACLPTQSKAYLDEQNRYLWASSNLYARTKNLATKAMQSKEFSLPPKEMMFISRKFIGAYAFLSAIDAKTDAQTLVGRYV